MKPLKNILPISRWMLRIAISIYVYFNFYNTFIEFQYKTIPFITSAIVILSTLGIVIGGLNKKISLTVLSAIVMSLAFLYIAYNNYVFPFSNQLISNFLILSIGVYFASSPEK